MAVAAKADDKTQWLPIGAKVMAGWGVFNLVFAVIVPAASLAIDPRLFTFGVDGARFVGMTWEQVTRQSPQMGEWMVLMMVAMCAFHFGYSVLTISGREIGLQVGRVVGLARARAVLGGGIRLQRLHHRLVRVAGASRHLHHSRRFPSGVSVGLLTLSVWAVVLFVGLWLPRGEVGQARES